MNAQTLKEKFSDREWNEIQLALMYSTTYNHGTSGHLAYTVIAKLFSMLLQQEEQE